MAPAGATAAAVVGEGAVAQPSWPRAATEAVAVLHARLTTTTAACVWATHDSVSDDLHPCDILVGFFGIPVSGARALQESAALGQVLAGDQGTRERQGILG